jgi:hypothetical protein
MKKEIAIGSLLVLTFLPGLIQETEAFQVGVTQSSEVKEYFENRKTTYEELARDKEIPVQRTACSEVWNQDTQVIEIRCADSENPDVVQTNCQNIYDETLSLWRIECTEIIIQPGDTSSFRDNTASLPRAYIFKDGNTLTEEVY